MGREPKPWSASPLWSSGQRFAAYVVPKPGADMVRDRIRVELSRYAVPRDVVVLDELPRNARGKVVPGELIG